MADANDDDQEREELASELKDSFRRLAGIQKRMYHAYANLEPDENGQYVHRKMQGDFASASADLKPLVRRTKILIDLLRAMGVPEKIPPRLEMYLKWRH